MAYRSPPPETSAARRHDCAIALRGGLARGDNRAQREWFRIKALTDPESLRRQLRMSALALSVAYWALLVVLISGFADGIAGSWFTTGRLWIWASLVILFAVALLMYPVATRPLARVRWALGAPILSRARKEVPKEAPVAGDLARMLAAWNPWLPAAVGGIGLVLILWMMVTKPF